MNDFLKNISVSDILSDQFTPDNGVGNNGSGATPPADNASGAADDSKAADTATQDKGNSAGGNDPGKNTLADNQGAIDDNDNGDDDSIVTTLQKKFGFDFEGEFSEDIDGVFELSKTAAEKMAEAQINGFFTQYPEVAEFADYVVNGGDPRKYFNSVSKTVDYSSMQIAEDDVSTQKMILSDLLSRQGFDKEGIETTLNSWEASKVLYAQTKMALPILDKVAKKEHEQEIAAQAEQAKQYKLNQEKEISDIQGIVAKGSIKGMEIPEAEKNKFLGFMFTPDENGVTKRNKMREEMSIEDKLALEYLMYKGFKLSDIVQRKVQTSKAQDLKNLLGGKNNGNRMRNGNSQSTDFKIPSLNEFLD